MPGIEISKKNHERLQALRDEEGLRSFNEVLDKILPDGTRSSMDFEKEKPAFVLFNNIEIAIKVLWGDLKKVSVGYEWTTDTESAKVIFKDNTGCLIRFTINENEDVYLNYFHFI